MTGSVPAFSTMGSFATFASHPMRAVSSVVFVQHSSLASRLKRIHESPFRCRQGELKYSAPRLWCAIRVVGAERSLDARSGDALRHRPTEPGHPVEHRAADPGFRFLGRQSPGAQAATDESFVAEHGGLPKRAPAVADRLLPAQAPLVPDRLDVLVPLTGRGARGRARHGG